MKIIQLFYGNAPVAQYYFIACIDHVFRNGVVSIING